MKLNYFTYILLLNAALYADCWLFSSSSKTEEKKEEPKLEPVSSQPAKEKHEHVFGFFLFLLF